MLLQIDQTWILIRSGEVRLVPDDGDAIEFRIELFELDKATESPRQYRFRVFRYDLFRISPTAYDTMTDKSERFADHEFLVVDPTFDLTTFVASTPLEAWDLLLEKMQQQFRAD